MKSFEENVKEYEELLKSYNSGEIKFAFHFADLSGKEIQLIHESIVDIMSQVKLHGNRNLMFQEVMNDYDELHIKSSFEVMKLCNMKTILSGVIQKVDGRKLAEFAMRGDSGYADLRLNMVRGVVAREAKGIDYSAPEQAE